MIISFDDGFLSEVNAVRKLRLESRIIERLSVRYSLYELLVEDKIYYAVAVADKEALVYKVFNNLSDGLSLFNLILNNEVDTASLDGVAEDFIYLLNENNML